MTNSLLKRIVILFAGGTLGYFLGKTYVRTITTEISIDSRPSAIFPYIQDFSNRPSWSSIKNSTTGFTFDTKEYPGTVGHSIRWIDNQKNISGILTLSQQGFQRYISYYGQQSLPYTRQYTQTYALQKGIKTTRVIVAHEEYMDANQMIFFMILGKEKRYQQALETSLQGLKRIVEQSPREKQKKSLNYILLKRQIINDF